ncbi:MAG: hypothetical protein AAGC64_01725 [Bacteroidota bacterium]
MIWNMMVKKEAYQPIGTEGYQEMIKMKTLATIKKQMARTGIS